MNNLIIIGNGFDLAHGLKTSYNHFIEYLIDSHIKSNQFKHLLNFGNDFKSFSHYRESKNPIQSIYFRNGKYQYYFSNKFVEILIQDLCLNNWCDIEKAYFKHLNIQEKSSYHFNNPQKLNEEFEDLKKELSEYLKIQEGKSKTIESYRKFFSIIDSNEAAILNFNYTDTLKSLYSNEIKESMVIHIHGELSNPKNPIIFGYAANDKESRELIDKDDNEYMRNIKKHLYKRTENEKILTNYLKGTKDINVTILGHSCGLSDKLILNQILNDENVKSINIFYYEEYEQYFQAQVNIDRIMNNDDNFKKLVDFNSSHRMPQHTDTEKQQEAFIKYITPIIEERKERKRIYDWPKMVL